MGRAGQDPASDDDLLIHRDMEALAGQAQDFVPRRVRFDCADRGRAGLA